MIVTHISPDFDAIGFIWLMYRYDPETREMPVAFVNTGSPERALLDVAYAVGDTGREYDPARRRFDHHHLPGKAANNTCATLQCAQWLVTHRPDVDFNPIWPIVELIFAGDTGRPEANQSRQTGIHALLSTHKARGASDITLLDYGIELLNDLAENLIAREHARRTLGEHTIYRSADGLIVAIKDAPQSATAAAFEKGARLVLFASEQSAPTGKTYARGILRGGEGADVHVGELVARIAAVHPYRALGHELDQWYKHEAGFFAGRGTAKAPCAAPMDVQLLDIARLVDAFWSR